MKLLTCTGCAKAGKCQRATDMRGKLKGLHITTLKFVCPDRAPIFLPGQAVIFTTFTCDEDDGYRGGVEQVWYRGHVIKQDGGKVFGFIPPGSLDLTNDVPFEAQYGGYVKMPLARVRRDSESADADVRECRYCAKHPGLGAACGRDPAYTRDSDCLATDVGAVFPRNPHVRASHDHW